MKTIGVYGFSCSCCGKELIPTDKVEACSDCGAIFCEECVLNRELDSHQCEE